MNESIDDELYRLTKAFDKLLGKIPRLESIKKDNMTVLMDYGLTYNEAKAWLEQEPNYVPIRRKETPFKSDNNETEPQIVTLIY